MPRAAAPGCSQPEIAVCIVGQLRAAARPKLARNLRAVRGLEVEGVFRKSGEEDAKSALKVRAATRGEWGAVRGAARSAPVAESCRACALWGCEVGVRSARR